MRSIEDATNKHIPLHKIQMNYANGQEAVTNILHVPIAATGRHRCAIRASVNIDS